MGRRLLSRLCSVLVLSQQEVRDIHRRGGEACPSIYWLYLLHFLRMVVNSLNFLFVLLHSLAYRSLRSPTLTTSKCLCNRFRTIWSPTHTKSLRKIQLSKHEMNAGEEEMFSCHNRYAEYENAVKEALLDRFAGKEKVIIMVVGAGRGPLVECSMRAAVSCNNAYKCMFVQRRRFAMSNIVGL